MLRPHVQESIASTNNHRQRLARRAVLHRRYLLATAILLTATGAQAKDVELPGVRINVFGSLGVSAIDSTDGLELSSTSYNRYEEDVDLEPLTQLGVQSTVALIPGWHAILQATAVPSNDYEATIDWAYVSVELDPKTTLRVGRMRRPMFRLADSREIGFGYNWTQPPSLAYINEDAYYEPITALNLLYHRPLGSTGMQFVSEYYLGIGEEGKAKVAGYDAEFTTEINAGLNLGIETDTLAVNAGFSYADYEFEVDSIDEAADTMFLLGYDDFGNRLRGKNSRALFSSLAAEYTLPNWQFIGELNRVDVNDSVSNNTTGVYAAAFRSFGDFTLGYTWSRQRGTPDDNLFDEILAAGNAATAAGDQRGAALQQIGQALQSYDDSRNFDRTAHTFTLRYDFMPNVAMKVEYERLDDENSDKTFNSGALVFDFIY